MRSIAYTSDVYFQICKDLWKIFDFEHTPICNHFTAFISRDSIKLTIYNPVKKAKNQKYGTVGQAVYFKPFVQILKYTIMAEISTNYKHLIKISQEKCHS